MYSHKAFNHLTYYLILLLLRLFLILKNPPLFPQSHICLLYFLILLFLLSYLFVFLLDKFHLVQKFLLYLLILNLHLLEYILVLMYYCFRKIPLTITLSLDVVIVALILVDGSIIGCTFAVFSVTDVI